MKIDNGGGQRPKVTGRDLLGIEGRKIRVSKAMEDFEGQFKDFVLDTADHWKPVVGCKGKKGGGGVTVQSEWQER